MKIWDKLFNCFMEIAWIFFNNYLDGIIITVLGEKNSSWIIRKGIKYLLFKSCFRRYFLWSSLLNIFVTEFGYVSIHLFGVFIFNCKYFKWKHSRAIIFREMSCFRHVSQSFFFIIFSDAKFSKISGRDRFYCRTTRLKLKGISRTDSVKFYDFNPMYVLYINAQSLQKNYDCF